MVDISTPEARAAHDLDLGRRYPYHGKQPTDWAEDAAIAICASLCDRRGIKQQMRDTDQDVKEEIVESFAAIIRFARDASVTPVDCSDDPVRPAK